MGVAQGRIAYVWGLIALMAVFAVGAGLIALALSMDDPVTRTRTVPAPPLSSRARLAQVQAGLEAPAQTTTGAELGGALAENCGAVDIYQQADGYVLVCHQGGA